MRRTRVEVKADLMRQAVDGYHAPQHLAKAAHLLGGEGSSAANMPRKNLNRTPCSSAASLTEARG